VSTDSENAQCIPKRRRDLVFVVGYSRSGTKFVCNLLERAGGGRVHHLGELHFFGRLAKTGLEPVSRAEIRPLLSGLAEQYLRRKNCPYRSLEEVLSLFGDAPAFADANTKNDVLRMFLEVVGFTRSSLVCDGTPRNAYYMREILCAFPGARIVYMLRDPRDCVLSQKRKPAKVRASGDKREALRLFLNYNPFIMARFWRASASHLEENEGDSRVLTVRYEEMLEEPESSLQRIGSFLDLDDLQKFASMVKQDKTREFSNGLSRLEVGAVEGALGTKLARHGYECTTSWWERTIGIPWWVLRSVVSFPVLYAVNVGRFSSAFHEIKKRLLR